MYADLPDIDAILAGHGQTIGFPNEPSVRYATTIGLTTRARDAQEAYQGLRWLTRVAASEWVQLCATDLFRLVRARGQWGQFKRLVGQDADLRALLAQPAAELPPSIVDAQSVIVDSPQFTIGKRQMARQSSRQFNN